MANEAHCQVPGRGVCIRPGRLDDLAQLQRVEVLAGAAFAELGMRAIADDDPPGLEALSSYCNDGRLWVAAASQDQPVAYLIADVVDGAAHIEQVSVHPDWSGRRIGQALMVQLEHWAREQRLSAITLTTFRDVPWNAPYYQRVGFEALKDPELTPGLRRIREKESDHGLDRWPRLCMQKRLEQSLER